MSFASLFLAVTIVAHEPGYYTSLANHVKRWLQSENVQSTVVAPAQMSSALQNEKLAFLVGFASPTKAAEWSKGWNDSASISDRRR